MKAELVVEAKWREKDYDPQLSSPRPTPTFEDFYSPCGCSNSRSHRSQKHKVGLLLYTCSACLPQQSSDCHQRVRMMQRKSSLVMSVGVMAVRERSRNGKDAYGMARTSNGDVALNVSNCTILEIGA